jgi:type IV secretion system protein VirB9
MIEFGPGERIENVSIGDALSWQVTPNRAATLLFVKPVDESGATNMTVVTSQRSYVFDLTSSAESPRVGDLTFVLRFDYPEEAPAQTQAASAPPQQVNANYSYWGSLAAHPAVVFDDGVSTYFQWPPNTATPAVFVLDERDRESIANISYRDGYLVVEQLAPRFRLRNGDDVATIANEGWNASRAGAAADARSPRATNNRRRGFLGLFCHGRRNRR